MRIDVMVDINAAPIAHALLPPMTAPAWKM
jgi:hypothetical protein